jgi:hypothetical protein
VPALLPSGLFLSRHPVPVPGTCVTVNGSNFTGTTGVKLTNTK